MSLQLRYPELQTNSVPPIESVFLSSKFEDNQQILQGQASRSDNPGAMQTYARFLKLQELEDWQGAVKALEKLIQLWPTPYFYHSLGLTYYKLGELQKSARVLEKTIKLYPNFSNVHLDLGLVYIALNKLNKALKSLRKAIKIEDDQAEAYFYLGHIHNQLRHTDLAIAFYQKAIHLKKDFLVAYLYLADFYLDLAHNSDTESIQYLNKAIEVYKLLLNVDPTNSAAYNNIGIIYTELGDTDNALEAYKEAVNIQRDNLLAVSNLGTLYINSKCYQNARNTFEQAISIFKQNRDKENRHLLASYLYMGLGVSLLRLYELESDDDKRQELHCEALEAFNTAIENDANNADAINNVGVIFHGSGRLEDAEKAFRKALELDPGNSISFDNLRKVKEDQLEQRLFDEGLIREIRKPITDFTPYQNRTPIKVKGKPLSETIIEERR